MKKVIDEIDQITEEIHNKDALSQNQFRSSDELMQSDLFESLSMVENIMEVDEENMKLDYMESLASNRMLKYQLYRTMSFDSASKNSSYSSFRSNSQTPLNYSPSKVSNSQLQTSIILDN